LEIFAAFRDSEKWLRMLRLCHYLYFAQVLDDVPREICSLQPRRRCDDVSRLVPRLTPKTRCVPVPREVCVRMRINPRRVRKPVVKTWCTNESPR